MSRNALSTRQTSRFGCRHFLGLALAALVVTTSAGCRMFSHSDNLEGVQLYRQGNYDAAARRFEQAVSTSPLHGDGYYNLAATLHQRWKLRRNPQDLEAAELLYNKCLEADERTHGVAEHRECYRGLAVLLVEKGDSDAAFRLLNTWAAKSVTPAEAKVELARLYSEFKDPEEAHKRLDEAIEIDPRNPRALAALAQLQEHSGDYHQAQLNYTRSLESDSHQPAVAQRIAALRGLTGSLSPTLGTTSGTRVVRVPATVPRY